MGADASDIVIPQRSVPTSQSEQCVTVVDRLPIAKRLFRILAWNPARLQVFSKLTFCLTEVSIMMTMMMATAVMDPGRDRCNCNNPPADDCGFNCQENRSTTLAEVMYGTGKLLVHEIERQKSMIWSHPDTRCSSSVVLTLSTSPWLSTLQVSVSPKSGHGCWVHGHVTVLEFML